MSAAVIPLPLLIPDAAALYEEAVHAHTHGQHLIHKGDGRVFVCPIVPPGWFKVAIGIKPAPRVPNAGALEVAA